MRSLRCCALLLWLSAPLLLMRPVEGHAQSVVLVHGSQFSPATMTEGSRLGARTVVSADVGSFIVLSFTWSSDDAKYPCEKWVIISNGSYTVGEVEERTPGQCNVSDAQAAAQAFGAQAPVQKLIFYADAKADDPTPPEKVQRSNEAKAVFAARLDELRRAPASQAVGPRAMRVPASSSTFDLSGTWIGNDGGAYYIRQIDDRVWWLGMSGDEGRSWTNLFIGTLRNDTIMGDWADTPRGATRNAGRMTLVVHDAGRVSAVERTGGFGGSEWTRAPNTPP